MHGRKVSMPRAITSVTSLDTLKKEAKRWLKSIRDGRPDARTRFEQAYPDGPATPVLRDVQQALAREYGQDNWIALKRELEARRAQTSGAAVTESRERYDRLANDVILAFNTRDLDALQRLNTFYGRPFTFEDLYSEIWRRLYSYRQRAFSKRDEPLLESEAQIVVASNAGFS